MIYNKTYKWQLLLLVVVAILLLTLTWLGINTNSAKYDKPIEVEDASSGPINIIDLLVRFSGSNEEINTCIKNIKADSSNILHIEALLTQGKNKKIEVIEAYALYLKGVLKSDTALLRQSANHFFESGNHDPDTLADKRAYGVYAIRACNFILKIQPENLAALTRKATAVVYFGGNIMTGVGLLKSVESIDSNYIDAQHYLMLLDLQSGQYKKAEKRLKKLVHLQPENLDYQDILLKLETQQIK